MSWDFETAISEDQEQELIVNPHWVESTELADPPLGNDECSEELSKFLLSVFKPDEYVNIVTDCVVSDDGRSIPTGSDAMRTAGQIIKLCKKNVQMGLGAKPCGVWVGINPLNGEGPKDANVTEFRHALIEAESITDLGTQLSIIQELKLPCSVVVHSGAKSIHAWVKVDASNMAEYRKRVDRLYDVAKASGLKTDTSNRNPSRLSRLPGVSRGSATQYVVSWECGLPSWVEWESYIEDLHDNLPDPKQLSTVTLSRPKLAPVLIEGVLRRGHKMLLNGPSKAGKSFGLIELAEAVASGTPWFGFQCHKGPVLYINLEIEEPSFENRAMDVREALGLPFEVMKNFYAWSLRGYDTPIKKLIKKIIRRASVEKEPFVLIIVDPIYKVFEGDENSTQAATQFFNALDTVGRATGAAIVACHHHSKGSQGQKRSLDRSSGSGVFGRDPDAILDMIELILQGPRREQMIADHVSRTLVAWMAEKGLSNESDEPSGFRPDTPEALADLIQNKHPDWEDAFRFVWSEAADAAADVSAWRVSAQVREFRRPKPVHLWFKYPLHIVDDTGTLQDAKADGEEAPWEAMQRSKVEARKAVRRDTDADFQQALDAIGGPGSATISGIHLALKKMGVDRSEKTVKRWAEKQAGMRVVSGAILKA